MIEVRLISNTEDFATIKQEWNDLLLISDSNAIFLTWEWAFSWWENFSDSSHTLFILVITDNNKTIAIAPLVIIKRIFFGFFTIREINFLGKKIVHGDYLDFIIASDCRQKEVVKAIFQYLNTHRYQWDILRLTDIPSDSVNVEYIADTAHEYKYRFSRKLATICPFVKLPKSWQELSLSLGRGFRNNLKKQKRRLQKQFELSFELYDSEHINEELEVLWALHEMRWKSRGMSGVFVDKRKRDFYRNIACRFSKNNWLQLWFLKINSKPIGAFFGFLYENKIYALQSGFDPEWSKYSIGQILLGNVMEQAIIIGCHEFDFLRGTESYKYDWGAIDRENIKLDISYRSIKTDLFYAMSFLKNKLLGLRK